MPSVFMRSLVGIGFATAVAATAFAFDGPPSGMAPADAILLLKDGNQRFTKDEPVHFQQDSFRRAETALKGQNPFAVVLTCSDSRVPPELIFDQGLGCLFVIRVAGNVARTDEIASIEYAVEHLGTRLVVVLGHTGCGAVSAVVEETHLSPNLAALTEPIEPAVARARAENPGLHGRMLIEATVRTNVEQAMSDLVRNSRVISLAVSVGRAQIQGAVYHLDTGEVEFLATGKAPTDSDPRALETEPVEPSPVSAHHAPTPEKAHEPSVDQGHEETASEHSGHH